MKIVYFTDILFPINNGTSTAILNLSTALSERGHEVIVIGPKPNKKNYEKLSNIPFQIKFFPSIPGPLYPDFRLGIPGSPSSIELIKKINPDIIHVQTPFTIGWTGIVLGRILKKPVVATAHGYFMDDDVLRLWNIKYSRKNISDLLWKYFIFQYNQCDFVTAPATLMQKDLIARGLKKKSTVIQNTIDEKHMQTASTQSVRTLKKKLLLKENVVLYVGRLSLEKNLDVLLKSIAYVIKEIPQTSLILIGDGPAIEKLQKLVKQLNITDHVLFLGVMKQKDLLTKGYFQLADVFATASTSEVQPVSLIEAFYFHLPVVAVSAKGAGETARDVGLLAKPYDEIDLAQNIIKVLVNHRLQKKLQEASWHAYEKRFAPGIIAKQFEDVYKKLLVKK